MSDWTTEYLQLIEDCEHRESRLSDWDRQFLDSLKRQIADGWEPSGKQLAKLDDIWDRATARG